METEEEVIRAVRGGIGERLEEEDGGSQDAK